ncbi:hypothetical protein EPUS_06684 [Endocarpon pusillum Z07020]|uniref:U3 small nucleolar RNA-associated protein 13 C-terminal domain-containing protein n=1 Tax=Endocarpon pusillum (strain Z07020 / HMAS-L-300199) TaxID=1263415 RepID=U1FVX6_ENDPU|nr:uncharacterized protein EPUS_06684 [Endocarpon pusillum Z07020]ERF68997.1 hypothetical protein EPUS_06684 [Endocarpon pusillum Z07020]
MSSRISIKTTFEPAKTIEPIYTGGDVSLDRSGRLLASCVEEDVLILNIQTGERVFRVENDGEAITSLALSPSASHLVVCSRSLSMRIYNLNSPKPELQTTLKPHTTPVITSTIDATGTLLATGGADGSVKVWDIKGGFVTHTFHGHGGLVSALFFFQITSGPMSKPKAKRKSIEADHASIDALSFFLASGGEDGKIRIWNLRTRKSVASLDSHVSVVKSLDFSEQQQTLLSAGRDKTMILWDFKSWKPRKVIPVLEVVEAAGFASDGKYCYSGGENGKVRIWSTSSGKEVTKEQIAGSESDSIVSIQCGPTFLLSVHLDQTIQLHNLQVLDDVVPGTSIDPLPLIRRISGNHDEIIDMALVGPDQSLLALATNTESIRVVSIVESTATPSRNFGADVALLSGHSDIIICLDVDWSGHWLATGAKDNSARLWRLDPSTSSYTCFASFTGHAESLGAISLPRTPSSPQAASDPLNHPPAYLITGSQDRTIKRWDTSKLNSSPSPTSTHSIFKSLYTRVAHEKDINAIDVSSTSSIFASASQDRTIKIWDLESGSVAGILRGHKRGVWSIRFAPKDTPPISTDAGSSSKGLLVSGSGDRTVKLWSLNTYTCILTFEGHSNSVLKTTPTTSHQPKSHRRPTPSSPRPHQIPSSNSGLPTLPPPQLQPPQSISDNHLLTTLDNHTDRVWALATPTTVSHPSNPTPKFSKSPLSSLSSIQDAYPLLSGSADATITLWTDTTTRTFHRASAAQTLRIEQDQALQNHMRARNYREVITLALQLNHPGRLLSLFEDVISNSAPSASGAAADKQKQGGEGGEKSSISGSSEVDDVLAHLSQAQLYALLLRVRDWNTNARTAPVAQRILHIILKSYPVSAFVDMARHQRPYHGDLAASAAGYSVVADPSTAGIRGAGGGAGARAGATAMKDLLRALEAYTERHLRGAWRICWTRAS